MHIFSASRFSIITIVKEEKNADRISAREAGLFNPPIVCRIPIEGS
jgi:hypothetical protein